jgi:DNA-binding response OmpR family regulator
VARAIDLGADDYLCRPYDPVLLGARIDAVLERKRLADQARIAGLGVLTSAIVHEVRNPLNFVVNFAELAEGLVHEQEALLEKSPAEMRRLTRDLELHLAKIREHGARIEEVLASMLAASGEPADSA